MQAIIADWSSNHWHLSCNISIDRNLRILILPMDHLTQEKTFISNKLGFHYFLDVEHFNAADSHLWIQKLQEINAKWLVINNPKDRAIPEEFIRSFSDAGINLIINFNEDISSDINLSSLTTLLNVYGKWGVKYTYLFEKPNLRSKWGNIRWNNHNVVETHLNKFIPFAQLCVDNHIKPIFSPLLPGGDYWDLAFLEKSLEDLASHATPHIKNNLILSAFGWDWGHSIEWGSGGNKKWREINPFHQKQNTQNQQGFRTYEWYLELSEKVFGERLPIVIFEAGIPNDRFTGNSVDTVPIDNLFAITHLLAGENVYDPENPELLLSPIPPEVIGCNFFILSAQMENKYFPYRWFTPKGVPLIPARSLGSTDNTTALQTEEQPARINNPIENFHFKYRRYILFSDSLKQNMPRLLEKLDPYIRKFKPHIGFSKSEAANAAYILIITDNKKVFLSDDVKSLSKNSIIKIISPNEIAELLSE
jgi:hypothetical protein